MFPPLMLGMIRAGEGSGKLDQVAERLAIHYEKAHQMNQQVKSALMYPMILAILAVAVVIVIVTFVLPQFSDLFSTMDSLPGVTLALMAFSNFMVTKWYLMILGVAVAVMVIRTLLRIPAVRLEMDRASSKCRFSVRSIRLSARRGSHEPSAACTRAVCRSSLRCRPPVIPSATLTSFRSSMMCSCRCVRASACPQPSRP